MQPVVPKIRVGDVLRGTKNLRNWLQAKSLLALALLVQARHYDREPENQLFTPRKDSKYIVLVNAWETFIAGDFANNACIIFCNGKVPGQVEPEMRMSPGKFATWFIRTKERCPDLKAWPDWAYRHWLSLQMNLCGSKHQRHPVMIQPGPSGPFLMAQDFVAGPHFRADKKEILQTEIPRGITRVKTRRPPVNNGLAHGPRLEDFAEDQEAIRKVTTNLRILKSIEQKLGASLHDSYVHSLLKFS